MQLDEREFDLRIRCIDRDAHGRNTAHFRPSRVAANRSSPQAPNKSVGRNPKVVKVQVHAMEEGFRPKPYEEQIQLPLRQ